MMYVAGAVALWCLCCAVALKIRYNRQRDTLSRQDAAFASDLRQVGHAIATGVTCEEDANTLHNIALNLDDRWYEDDE